MKRFLLLGLFTLFIAVLARAEDPYADHLLGDMGGLRNKLADKGVDLSLEYKGDLWGTTSGGVAHGWNYLDNTDIKFNLDGKKLFDWDDTTMLIYFLNNEGSKPNATRAGTLQGIDNIETQTNTFKLYEAWIQKNIDHDKWLFLFGLHDLNTEFMSTDMTSNFTTPSFQNNQTIAQSGKNGPSVFPTTSLAFRVKYAPVKNAYAEVGIFDGVPGNPGHNHFTHIDLRASDGLLLIAEAGVTPGAGDDGAPNKFGIGSWYYTRSMDNLSGAGQSHQSGSYLLATYQFYKQESTKQNLGAFILPSISTSQSEECAWSYEAGLVGHGWLPLLKDDEIGFGLSQSHNGASYLAANPGSESNEYSLDLYYRGKIGKGVSLQPEVKYIINPGTNSATVDTIVAGIRLDVVF